MSEQHTPGPWNAKRNINIHDQALIISEATGANVAVVYDAKDADIIAAVPHLLEALHIIAAQSLGDDWTAEQAVAFIKEEARAAIRLTRGGS